MSDRKLVFGSQLGPILDKIIAEALIDVTAGNGGSHSYAVDTPEEFAYKTAYKLHEHYINKRSYQSLERLTQKQKKKIKNLELLIGKLVGRLESDE